MIRTLLLAATLSSTACIQVMAAVAPTAEDVEPGLSAAFPYTSRFVDVKGSKMHYVEVGSGDPILLVHGNPTSSYLWRNVIPHLEDRGRVIAVDLIGMGRSDKPDVDYRFATQAAYLEGFVEALDLRDVHLVLHDWGGGVGLDYYARHTDNVASVTLMEAVVKPMVWEQADLPTRYLFGRLRDPADGQQLNGEQSLFVETLLPMMAGRALSEAEMAAYRAPFPSVASRAPVVQWPREIPISGEPADNTARIGGNYDVLRGDDVPVLFLYAEPGLIFGASLLDELREQVPRATFTSVGSGIHYLQETQPTRIGETIAAWLPR
jgi:haloalkane dehalogenase